MLRGVTLLEKAAVRRLVSLASVKARLGAADSEDSVLLDLIEERSSAIEAFLGFDLARQKYEEQRSGEERDFLFLPLARFPLDPDSLAITVDGVAVTDFEVTDPGTAMVYRSAGWAGSDLVATYYAGYVLPEAFVSWPSVGQPLAAGAWLRGSSSSTVPLLYEVTTGGTAGAEPTYPTTAGDTVTSDGVTITARAAEELPAALRAACALAVQLERHRLTVAPGVASIEADGFRESYFQQAAQGADLPTQVTAALWRWRNGR